MESIKGLLDKDSHFGYSDYDSLFVWVVEYRENGNMVDYVIFTKRELAIAFLANNANLPPNTDDWDGSAVTSKNSPCHTYVLVLKDLCRY